MFRVTTLKSQGHSTCAAVPTENSIIDITMLGGKLFSSNYICGKFIACVWTTYTEVGVTCALGWDKGLMKGWGVTRPRCNLVIIETKDSPTFLNITLNILALVSSSNNTCMVIEHFRIHLHINSACWLLAYLIGRMVPPRNLNYVYKKIVE